MLASILIILLMLNAILKQVISLRSSINSVWFLSSNHSTKLLMSYARKYLLHIRSEQICNATTMFWQSILADWSPGRMPCLWPLGLGATGREGVSQMTQQECELCQQEPGKKH
jgi:hypothetical protein